MAMVLGVKQSPARDSQLQSDLGMIHIHHAKVNQQLELAPRTFTFFFLVGPFLCFDRGLGRGSGGYTSRFVRR
jgi:hypothetical protein